MNKSRPVNLDLSTVRLPITAYVSILHRVSGVVILGGVLLLVWMLDISLSSSEGFSELQAILAETWAKVVLWLVLAALTYHLVAGVKHLVMDMGIGETLEGGKLGAKLTLAAFFVLVILEGVWLW